MYVKTNGYKNEAKSFQTSHKESKEGSHVELLNGRPILGGSAVWINEKETQIL